MSTPVKLDEGGMLLKGLRDALAKSPMGEVLVKQTGDGVEFYPAYDLSGGGDDGEKCAGD